MLLAPVAAFSAGKSADMFGKGRAEYHLTNFAPYALKNTVIKLHFDFAQGVVYGRERVDVRIKGKPLSVLTFNSLGIRYQSISVNGNAAAYTVDPDRQTVDVTPRHPMHPGQDLTVDFQYWAKPIRGMYFIRPDKAYPDITPEIWTQGEAVDNRRWFPTWDEPNEKTPSELIIDVPVGWTAIANGYLRSHRRSSLGETWDWRSPQPKSTYLIAFVAGPLTRHKDRLGNLDVDSFVQPPLQGLNALCFGRTPSMIAFYAKLLDVPYPFSKYDQTTAERFIFGGMENESAATQSDLALHPQIEDIERPCDGLVSHELAQNWFGDDATMADWSNAWLNEGFATYFEELWTEHHNGAAAFEYARYDGQQAYLEESEKYQRPIVDYVYNDPIDLLDVSGHERAAAVIHMLRYLFGDKRFFSALHNYLVAYAYKNANTDQFFQSMGQSLHADLTWFEREWFYRTCIPHYIVSDEYDFSTKTLTVRVQQANADAKPFVMPAVVEVFWGSRSVALRKLVKVNDSKFVFRGVSSKPDMILFDPNNNLLRTLTYNKPVSDLIYQLKNASHVGDREWALNELAKHADPEDVTSVHQAIRGAIDGDTSYHVRADAAVTAGALDDADGVRDGLQDRDKRVRLAAEGGAAKLVHPSSELEEQLFAMSSDLDPIVAASALASLGALHAPGIHQRLLQALDTTSFRQAVASGALRGLSAEGDLSAWDLVVSRTQYGTQEQERNVAVVQLAHLARKLNRQDDALGILMPLLNGDHLITTRVAAAQALGILGDARALPGLREALESDPEVAVHDEAWEAMNLLIPAVPQ